MRQKKQNDGNYTIEAEANKILEHKRTHHRTHLAADQNESQLNDWQEADIETGEVDSDYVSNEDAVKELTNALADEED